MTFLFGFIGLFLLSTCLTEGFRRYALKKELLDHPNHRSSHSEATPRGAGIVFVSLFLVAFWAAYGLNMIPASLFKAFIFPALIIAVLGYCDDIKGLPAKLRFAVQLSAAVIFLYLIHGWILGFGAVSLLLIMVALIWSTNLYNFMDGTDGLSSVEAITVYGVGGFLLWSQGAYSLALIAEILVATVTGFLVWNWPKARVFMGDSGSTLLGFLIVPLALVSYVDYGLSVFVWIILYLFFLMDTMLTLLRRLLHREKWYEAHRLHAYQRLYQAGYTHVHVLMVMIGLNLIFTMLALSIVFYSMSITMAFLVALFVYLIFYAFVEYKFPMYPKQRGAP